MSYYTCIKLVVQITLREADEDEFRDAFWKVLDEYAKSSDEVMAREFDCHETIGRVDEII